MKLSEAILKGCEMTEPVVGWYFHYGENRLGACALGAAYVGVMGEAIEDGSDLYFNGAISDLFPVIDQIVSDRIDRVVLLTRVGSEAYVHGWIGLGRWIARANDDGYSREWIAARLEEAGL